MIKQLIITLSSNSSELEVADFLAVSGHSPKWIGNLDDWHIKSLSINNVKLKELTALLENDNWECPKLELDFSVNYLKLVLDENPLISKVYFINYDDGSEMLMGPKPCVSELLYDKKCVVILSTGESGYYKDGAKILNEAFSGKLGKIEDKERYLALNIDNKVFPVTGHYIEDNKLYLIYTKDFNLDPLKLLYKQK